MRENQGYIITDSIHIGNVEFVVGVSAKAPDQFVTWECQNSDDFYWGHYFSDRLSAKRDLLERAGHELRYREREQEQAWERQAAREKERER